MFLGMTLLHAHAQYIFIVCAKYQKASVKALVQVDFPLYALSKHKQNPFLKANRKKKAKFTKLSLCHKLFFFGIKLVHAKDLCVFTV